jgi:hypothetical protein
MGGGTNISTTTQDPWKGQQRYLKTGFNEAETLMRKGAPDYYSGPTLAGFDPLQTMAQKGAVGYAAGPRAAAMQQGAEQNMLGLMGGGVDTRTFGPVMQSLGNQMRGQLTGNVLPGIRQAITQYQPGGGTRGDLVQSKAISSANQQMLDKAAQMYQQSYEGAQGRRLGAGQQYPTTMAAPLGMMQAVGDVGKQRRSMAQEGINRNISQYNYEAFAPQNALNNYMNTISGNYGGQTQTAGPSDNSGMMNMLGSVASAAILASDVRVKENLKSDGTWNGFSVYKYNYIGDSTPRRGVIAQEVEETHPEAVVEIDGVKHVNYSALAGDV